MAPFSLDGFGDLMETVETVQSNQRSIGQNSDKDIKIVLTMHDVREKTINEWIYKQLESYREMMFETVISRTTELKKSQVVSKPIFLTAPKSRAAADYEKLTQEFLNL
jgi:chromosome partitioning protein